MQDQHNPKQHNPDTATLFDHSRFIVLREALLNLLDRKAPDAEIEAQLDELLQHLQQQFAAEERQMQITQFPASAAHKTEHDRTLAKLAHHIAQWRNHRDATNLLDYVETGLADWFVKHVNTRDFVTAQFIAIYQPDQTGKKPLSAD